MKLGLSLSLPSEATASAPLAGESSATETYTVNPRQTILFTSTNRSLNRGFTGELASSRYNSFPTLTSLSTQSQFSGDTSSSSVTLGGQRVTQQNLGREHSPSDYYNPSADNQDRVVVFNFANVNIKQGATISNAKISFKKGTTSGSLASGQSDLFKIHAPLTDDSVWFNNPIDTGTKVDWTGLFAATNNTTVESPDISSVIQEIVDIPTWKSGNSFQIALFFAASASQNQSATIQVKTGYNSDNSTNSDGVPQLEVTHSGGSDYAGTIIEGVERENISSSLNNVGSSFGTNNTHNNTGSYGSTSASNDGTLPYGIVRRLLTFTGYYNSSADATFESFVVRFPSIPLAQGSTVPTTKLSFVIPNHHEGEVGYESLNSSSATRTATITMGTSWNAHTYETGHHATNGDGTNDAVGIRIRAVKLTDVAANFSGLTHSDFNHPSGTTETGVSTVTDAFVDLSLNDYYTQTSVYSSGAANEREQKYMKVTKDQPRFETPDLKNILQEIVNQSGWSSGNAIALLFYLPSFHTGAVSGTNSNKVDGLNFTMLAGIPLNANDFDFDYQNLKKSTNTFNAVPVDQRKLVGRMPKLLIG